MTDIYAFGPDWALPTTVQNNVRQVVQDWLAANPSGDALVNQKLTALESGKADKTHTHTTAQVDGLAAALAAAGKVQSVLGKTGAITAQDFIDAGLNGSGGSLELQAAKDYTNTAVGTRVPFRLSGGQDLNTLTVTEDVLFTGVAGMMNAPDTSVGALQIRNAGGNISQVWRPLARTAPVCWSRVRTGSPGTWSPWAIASPTTIAPPSSRSFDDIRDSAVYPIQNVAHAGMPVSAVGTLIVYPSTGLSAQMYLTWEAEPRLFMRRATSASAWGPWVALPTASTVTELTGRVETLENNPAAPGSKTSAPSVPTRAPLTASPTNLVSKPMKEIMVEMSEDRLVGWNCYGSEISETTDEGATWRALKDKNSANPFAGSQIESTMRMDNGELLLSCTRGAGMESRRELWVSKNIRDDSTREFVKTLTARAWGIKFTRSWSQSTHGPIVLVNEYGPKMGEPWGGNEVADGENARYTYMSTDYGKTWRTVFDLNEYVVTKTGRPTASRQHLHGVAWDPWWDRIWITYGDNLAGAGSNGVAYSDDLGTTWQTAYFYSGSDSPFQLVGIVPMPKCVLFGCDNQPQTAIHRIDRAAGKSTVDGRYTITAPWTFDGGGKHLLQAHTRINRVGNDAPALFAYGSEGIPAKSVAVATLDGFTFVEIWRDTVEQSAGTGSRSIVGPTLRGQVIIGSSDQRVPGMWSQITTRAPGY